MKRFSFLMISVFLTMVLFSVTVSAAPTVTSLGSQMVQEDFGLFETKEIRSSQSDALFDMACATTDTTYTNRSGNGNWKLELIDSAGFSVDVVQQVPGAGQSFTGVASIVLRPVATEGEEGLYFEADKSLIIYKVSPTNYATGKILMSSSGGGGSFSAKQYKAQCGNEAADPYQEVVYRHKGHVLITVPFTVTNP